MSWKNFNNSIVFKTNGLSRYNKRSQKEFRRATKLMILKKYWTYLNKVIKIKLWQGGKKLCLEMCHIFRILQGRQREPSVCTLCSSLFAQFVRYSYQCKKVKIINFSNENRIHNQCSNLSDLCAPAVSIKSY